MHCALCAIGFIRPKAAACFGASNLIQSGKLSSWNWIGFSNELGAERRKPRGFSLILPYPLDMNSSECIQPPDAGSNERGVAGARGSGVASARDARGSPVHVIAPTGIFCVTGVAIRGTLRHFLPHAWQ